MRSMKRISDRLIFFVLAILCTGAIGCHMEMTACCIITCLMAFRPAPQKTRSTTRRRISINDR